MVLPTEPHVILAMAATIDGCAPDCWHCRAWAHIHNAQFPFDDARATALAAGSGSPSAVGDRPAASGGAQGRRPWGSDRPVQAPPTSEFGPGRVLHLLLGGRA